MRIKFTHQSVSIVITCLNGFVAYAAVPLLVAGGGGGVGIDHSNEDDFQNGRNTKHGRGDLSGHRKGEHNTSGGAGKKYSASMEYSIEY